MQLTTVTTTGVIESHLQPRKREWAHLVPAVLALLAAGLCGSVRQAAAGGGRLSVPVPVPVFVSEPGEGHAGGDGRHGLGWAHVAPGLLQ